MGTHKPAAAYLLAGKGPLNNQPDFDYGLFVVNDLTAIVEEVLDNWPTMFPGE